MSKQKDREEFISLMTTEGMKYDDIRAILRYGATLTRLAEAQCNGDYPCDNGERKTKVCAECGLGYAPMSLNKAGVCPECRTQHKVEALLPSGFEPLFNGDPRGCVLKIKVPSGKTNDWGREGICVP